ncbi:MAG: addiction module protein [Candidatus Aminicenantes bacterium]|jgi:putative addiction module component (TIGR02574 family)|nr:addiction module protein [Candidatus Aminicenantes bacterium]
MMLHTQEDVLTFAMTLPPDDRALLADRLLNSLDSPQRKEINLLWADEAERRIQQVIDGKVTPLPGVEVIQDIRKTLNL